MARKRTTTTAPGLEATENTAPLQEQQDTVPEGQSPANESKDATTAPEPAANPDTAQQEDAPPPPEPAPIPAGERPIPYKAAVGVSVAVLHKAIGPGTADMLKPVGSLRQGAAVTVTARKGQYVQLKNGLYILEAFLTA